MDMKCKLLGVYYDVSCAFSSGFVEFEPSDDNIAKLKAQLREMRRKQACTPGEASKFRGRATH